MDAAPLELRLIVPADARCAAMVRDVVEHGARHVGCSDAKAVAFGHLSEEAARESLAEARPDESISIVVRRGDGHLDVLITTGRRTCALALEI